MRCTRRSLAHDPLSRRFVAIALCLGSHFPVTFSKCTGWYIPVIASVDGRAISCTLSFISRRREALLPRTFLVSAQVRWLGMRSASLHVSFLRLAYDRSKPWYAMKSSKPRRVPLPYGYFFYRQLRKESPGQREKKNISTHMCAVEMVNFLHITKMAECGLCRHRYALKYSRTPMPHCVTPLTCKQIQKKTAETSALFSADPLTCQIKKQKKKRAVY